MTNQQGRPTAMGWGRFAAMIVTSSTIMFFLMYHLVYDPAHLTFSLTRLLSSVLMGAVMTGVMLAFMWPMYPGQVTKLAVLAAAVLASGSLLWVNRSQALVGDSEFMRAMIPHHSIAINNSRRAAISDPRVRKLADEIIETQVREIAEMKALLASIEREGERGARPLSPQPETGESR